MKTTILPLTRAALAQQLEAFQQLDAETKGERWGAEHFLQELPGKWECSRVAFDAEGRLAGFAIASLKKEALHLHRLVVGPPHRRSGLGTRLLLAMAHCAQHHALPTVTLKLDRANTDAWRLYERLGFTAQPSATTNLECAVPAAHLMQTASGATLATLRGGRS
jgi:ribosomal protein S18 acetylase RimI-like enzyme